MEKLIGDDFLFDLINTKYEVNSEKLRKKIVDNPDFVRDFLKKFSGDLFSKRLSYSDGTHMRTPLLEGALQKFVSNIGAISRFQRTEVFISHDIDYLYATLRMIAKRFVGYQKLSAYRSSYISSIDAIFEISREFAGKDGEIVAFVAAPMRSKDFPGCLKEWLIDPSYDLSSSHFSEFLEISKKYGVTLGLHGSLNSIEKEKLNLEKRKLEERIDTEVVLNRQHWLNLPDKESFSVIEDAGIVVDSSLGWNGEIGFRGGLLGPFKLPSTSKLIEIPLVAMDGALFDDLGYSELDALNVLKDVFSQTFQFGGVLAIDWHDRAADTSYKWSGLYSKLLEWLSSEGIAPFSPSKFISRT